MKNYELIEKLMKQPAGMEVRFCGTVPRGNIVDDDEAYCLVTSPIDIEEGIINFI